MKWFRNQIEKITAMLEGVYDSVCQTFAVIATKLIMTNFQEHQLVLIYLLFINAWTGYLYWKDKRSSQEKTPTNSVCKRTPEKRLLLFGLLGGWVGALFAQQIVRNKTRKVSFRIKFAISIAANVFISKYMYIIC